MNCPECDEPMERWLGADDMATAGWFCEECDVFIHESEIDWVN